jgi:hypothetical protein
MRSAPLALLLATSLAIGLDLKPSLAPAKNAPVPARPVAAPTSTPTTTPKPEAPKEPEVAPVVVARFANPTPIVPDLKAIQIALVGFVDRGSRSFLEFKLVGAENGADALCHVRLLDADAKPIGYLKAYLHAKGTSFDLAVVEKDPVKRKALLERTQSILIQGTDKTQGIMATECRRAK